MHIDRESLAHVVWCVGLALIAFVSWDIKIVIRDDLISLRRFNGRKGTLEPLSGPGSTVCQRTSSSTRKKFLHT